MLGHLRTLEVLWLGVPILPGEAYLRTCPDPREATSVARIIPSTRCAGRPCKTSVTTLAGPHGTEARSPVALHQPCRQEKTARSSAHHRHWRTGLACQLERPNLRSRSRMLHAPSARPR